MHIYIYLCILRSGVQDIIFVFLLQVKRKLKFYQIFLIFYKIFCIILQHDIFGFEIVYRFYTSYIVMTWPFLSLMIELRKYTVTSIRHLVNMVHTLKNVIWIILSQSVLSWYADNLNVDA
jgi:hypothetical protein